MANLLVINSSSVQKGSNTRELVQHLLPQWLHKNPETEVIHRDLVQTQVPHITEEMIGAYYTAPEERTAEQNSAIKLSDELVDELEAADTIVIGVPMYNFGIPSVLKAYFDHIARVGRTFSYTSEGPKGLLENKKAILISASGGAYLEGTPAYAMNFVDPYLKQVLGFVGITDITVINAAGVASDAGQVGKAKEAIDAYMA